MSAKRGWRAGALLAVMATAALLGTGCMWGVVRDAASGMGLPGVSVKFTDGNGVTQETTTGPDGVYVFDGSAAPAPGPVNLELSGQGLEPLSEMRWADFADNPAAGPDDLLSRWDLQDFLMRRTGVDLALDGVSVPLLGQEQVSVTIKNEGTASVTNAAVEVVCLGTRVSRSDGLVEAIFGGPDTVTVSLNPGQSADRPTSLVIDTDSYWYVLACGIKPPEGDGNVLNDLRVQEIPGLGDMGLEPRLDVKADFALAAIVGPASGQGNIQVTLRNEGPQSAINARVGVLCFAARTARSDGLISLLAAPPQVVTISLNPGQEASREVHFPVDTGPYRYGVACAIEAGVEDPDPLNNVRLAALD